jgi:HAE1 family hydrophobic/amphiphilic exporter-1
LHTNQYIAELRPKIAKLLAPGASLMVMQKKLRGIRQVGESEIEVEISGAPRRALRSDQTA